MRLGTILVGGLFILGCTGFPGPGSAPPADPGPLAVVADADRLAARDLWPGFDPRTVPVAIHQDGRTWLFRHPNPPPEFQPWPDRPGVFVAPGRHSGVTANSSAEIGGVVTATLLPPGSGETLTRRAGVLLHEMFHVFQRRHHPKWTANEADLFTYPVDVQNGAALRSLEVEALRRGLLAEGPETAACWGQAAMTLRRERFLLLSPAAIAYERGTELNEGLAAYVQHRATGERDEALLPPEGYPPHGVRQRAYGTGAAMARLLDRMRPDWRGTLERSDTIPLDALLATAQSGSDGACGFAPDERRGLEQRAAAAVSELRALRTERRQAFLGQPGWTLEAVTEATPIFPQGFDPLNVEVVGPGEVLHTRYLKLGGPAGEIEIIGRSALTAAAGPHPLFNGVRRLVVTGLPNDPVARRDSGSVHIQAPGISGVLRIASVVQTGQTVTLTLSPR